MSVGLYQVGTSGLLAAQQQLATTGHNISNVNTEGYTRQRAEQNASLGFSDGANYVGTGTYIQDITRIYDQFSYKEQLINQSNLGNSDFLESRLTQLDQVMSTSGGALVTSIDELYKTFNSVADNPNDSGLRNIALTQAETLSSGFNELSDNFDKMKVSVNGEIEQVVNKISEISVELAKINETILHSQGINQGGQPNDLLDKRDQLVNELSKYTSVNTITDQNGVMSVMVGQGTTLVAGITPLTIQVKAGDPDPLKTQLSLVGPNSSVAIDSSTLAGALGASFEFRDEHLLETGNEIDRLAMAISFTLNDSQASGLDLNAKQGANIFTNINTTALQQGRVSAPSSNGGDLQAKVNITDVSILPADEFEVRYNGAIYTITNMNTGQSEDLGAVGTGTHATSFGFEFIETSGTPANDDSYIIKPSHNSSALMNVTLTDANAIAASTAVEVTASTHNVSDGQVKISNVSDPEAARAYINNPNSGLTVDVYESAAGTFTYRVFDSANPPPAATIATGSYLAGESALVDLPPGIAAFQIEIKGNLVGSGINAREEFTISDAFGVGNGNNAVAMAKTQEQGITNGNKETFNQSLAISTSKVGAKASNATLVADTAQALFTQAFNRNQSTSGVNLDEEAANLLKFQQAYQAASQIISTANTIFDTILSAVR
jgi:flagellar hook-associated protein 1 FlgK